MTVRSRDDATAPLRGVRTPQPRARRERGSHLAAAPAMATLGSRLPAGEGHGEGSARTAPGPASATRRAG